MRVVQIDVFPEPTPEEREALIVVLKQLDAERAPYASPWSRPDPEPAAAGSGE